MPQPAGSVNSVIQRGVTNVTSTQSNMYTVPAVASITSARYKPLKEKLVAAIKHPKGDGLGPNSSLSGCVSNFAAMRSVGPEESLSFQDKDARPHAPFRRHRNDHVLAISRVSHRVRSIGKDKCRGANCSCHCHLQGHAIAAAMRSSRPATRPRAHQHRLSLRDCGGSTTWSFLHAPR
jgi:hypothetical protein